MTLFTKKTRWAAIMACSATVGLAAITGCKSSSDMSSSGDAKTMMMNAPMDIIQTATGPNMEDVTTLVKAVQAAGLVETLETKTGTAPAPFTVFAPTNEAFAALPPGTLDMLLKPENKDKLKAILLYHVHPGAGILAKDASTMSLSTADGDKMLAVSVMGGNVMVNDAKVVKADIVCSNGVIHWIDKVLMPPTMGNTPMPGM